jgi:HlyD family secretion protein
VVITRAVEVGQTVASSFNTPTLFQIANDLSKMEIDAMVSEADVGGVLEGQPVLFKVDAYMNRQFKGSVKQVRFAPTTNQNVVTYTTVIEVNNEDLKLRPGMTANLDIVVGQKSNVLKIPNSALRVRLPENVIIKPAANQVAAAKGSNAVAKAGDASGLPDFSSMTPEQRRAAMQNLTPEQRAALRERRGGRRGGEEGGGRGGESRAQQEGPGPRTVYVLVKTNSPSGAEIEMAKPVTITTGLSDSMYTEVVEGLAEGDEVITGLNQTTTTASAMRPGSTPFGGGMGGGFRGR